MRIIFHIPERLSSEPSRASQIRPLKIIHEFEKMGYKVDLVVGTGHERKKCINRIKKNILLGVKYLFVYSEATNTPTLLTEDSHWPLYPFLDCSFFHFCKKNSIKIGLFYRDVYWVFYPNKSYFKQKILWLFYHYDIVKYNTLIDVLFLPSLEMKLHIPNLSVKCIEALPSGVTLKHVLQTNSSYIRLLFIGAVGGLYDLRLLIEAVAHSQKVKLVVCCNKDNWEREKANYADILNENIEIVHKKGEDIVDLYRNTDIACVFFRDCEYLDFAVPYKLYESIGYSCPVLANINTLTGKYVEDNKVGYTCEYNIDSLKMTLDNLSIEHINELRSNIQKVACENTWEKRCCKIIDVLTNRV